MVLITQSLNSELALEVGMDEADMDRILRNHLTSLRVDQLKTLIKALRRHTRSRLLSSLSGRKSELIERLRSVIEFPESNHPARFIAAPRPPPPAAHFQSIDARMSVTRRHRGVYTPKRPPSSLMSTSSSSASSTVGGIEQLTSNPRFKRGRNPHHGLQSIIVVKPLSSHRKACLRFHLEWKSFKAISMDKTNAVHLRLFSHQAKHFEWDTFFRVIVNNMYITVTPRKKPTGVKKKGYCIVKTLDISRHLRSGPNTVEVVYSPFGMPAEVFDGVCAVEYVRFKSSSEIVQDLLKVYQMAGKPVGSVPPPLKSLPEKRCGFCGTKDDLLRCSRCKSQWYCSTKHQTAHWPQHKLKCVEVVSVPSLTSMQPVSLASATNMADDDDIVELESKVSLTCPLSISRLKIPAKGVNCRHPQCFELESFLEYCSQLDVWQCPVCYKALPHTELRVDRHMKEILEKVGPDHDQVKLKVDGTFTVIDDDADQNKRAKPEAAKDDDTADSYHNKRRKTSTKSEAHVIDEEEDGDEEEEEDDDDEFETLPPPPPARPSRAPWNNNVNPFVQGGGLPAAQTGSLDEPIVLD